MCLLLDGDRSAVRFVAFVLQCFLRRRPKVTFIRVLRKFAIAPDHLFAHGDSHYPL